jgi:hypothetical protein
MEARSSLLPVRLPNGSRIGSWRWAKRQRELRSYFLVSLLALLVFVASGCGGGDGGGDSNEPVKTADESGSGVVSTNISQYRSDIAYYCLNEITGGPVPKDYAESYGAMLDAVDGLIDEYRKDPNATYESTDGTLTMRQVLTDAANSLQDCGERGPENAEKLDRVLAE